MDTQAYVFLTILKVKFLAQNKELSLSKRELNLLELFMLKNNRSISKENLLEKLYSWDEDASAQELTVTLGMDYCILNF